MDDTKDKEIEIQDEIVRLYTEYKSKMLIYIKAAVKDSSMADDILQDVFLEALKKSDIFNSHPNPIGWLYRTARFKILEYERRLQAQHEVGIDEGDVVVSDRECGYLESEFKALLDDMLSDEERLRYFRYFRWGLSVEEMAKLEGVSENNMRVRITRLKKKLLQHVNGK